MKNLFYLLAFLSLISCTSDEGSPVSTNGDLTFNAVKYGFDHVYIRKRSVIPDHPHFEVYLTKGTLTGDTYSSDFSRMLVFVIFSSSETLASGTRNFSLDFDTVGENTIMFRNNFDIEGGNAVDYSTVFDRSDNTSEQSRVVINRINDNEYSFDFNVITSAGVLTGTYRGEVSQ